MNDIELIELIITNTNYGITKAIELYSGSVKAICNNVLRGYSREDIDEAWSDTFVNLWKNIQRFDTTQNTSLKTYICTIARNSSLYVRRKANKNMHSSIDDLAEDGLMDVSIDVENEVVSTQCNNVILEALNEMEEPDKSVFVLRFYLFTPIKEIAERLKLKPKKVENILTRKKEVIKKALIERGITND